MSMIPQFEVGIWNAWILQLLVIAVMFITNLFLSEEGKNRNKRLEGFVPSSRIIKILAWSTHIVIWPIVIIYSIFLPLKLNTAWLYVGLFLLALGLTMMIMVFISAANTPLNEPVTRGAYRFSRHPVYLSGFLTMLGTGIAGASWLVLIFALLWMVFFIIVAPTEERFCLDKYGDSYRDYVKRTPRWIGIPQS